MQTRVNGLVDEVAAIVGTYGDAPSEVTQGQFPHGRRFVATLTASGADAGTCTVTFDYAGAQAIAKLIVEGDAPTTDASIANALQSLLEQAAAALASRGPNDRADLTIASVESGGMGIPEGDTTSFAMTLAGSSPVAISVTWEAHGANAAATAAATAAAGAAAGVMAAPKAERIEDRIDVILDIDLPIVVRFGRTELPIRQLTRLGMGSVIDLGRSPDDPVELLVSDRVIAHGEVVIVGGNYGIRILDVASAAERVRSMEA